MRTRDLNIRVRNFGIVFQDAAGARSCGDGLEIPVGVTRKVGALERRSRRSARVELYGRRGGRYLPASHLFLQGSFKAFHLSHKLLKGEALGEAIGRPWFAEVYSSPSIA